VVTRTPDLVLSDAEVAGLREALEDAMAYRWQLAGSCPRDCMSHGTSCEDCERHQDAAGRYEHLDATLAGHASRRYPVTMPGDIKVKGDLL
jgi:hypothetical protein